MTELERALVALGRELDVPEPPDLVPAVRARLEPRPRPARRRRWAVAVALALVALLGAALAIPDARSALLRVLSIGGERIELVDELPSVPPSPAELDLDVVLGERVTLADARSRAGFDLLELDEAPDRVYLGGRGTIWFLYGTPDRVRLLVAQTPRARIDEPFILKKLVPPMTDVEEVDVDGVGAFFLSGRPHVVGLLDENGTLVLESTRLARDVLVWERDGVALRLEGDLTLDEAVELARSLR